MTIFEQVHNGFTLAIESLYLIKKHTKLLVIPLAFFTTLLALSSIFLAMANILGIKTVEGVAVLLPSELSFMSPGQAQFFFSLIFESIKMFLQLFFSSTLAFAAVQIVRGQPLRIEVAFGAAFAARKIILLFSIFVVILFLGFGHAWYISPLLHVIWFISACFVPVLIAREHRLPFDALQHSVQLGVRFTSELLGVLCAFVVIIFIVGIPFMMLLRAMQLFGELGKLLVAMFIFIPLMSTFMLLKELAVARLYCVARKLSAAGLRG